MSGTGPVEPVEPIDPAEPAEPAEPVSRFGRFTRFSRFVRFGRIEPADTGHPVDPIDPIDSDDPIGPVDARRPRDRLARDLDPIGPIGPVDPDKEAGLEGLSTTRTGSAHEGARQSAPRPDHDIITGPVNSPLLSDRWYALSPRLRRLLLTAGAVGAGAAVTAALLLSTSKPPPQFAPDEEPETPWPASVTDFRYTGTASAPASGNTSRAGAFRFTVSVRRGSPVTIERVSAAFQGLTARTTPVTPFSVRAGTSRPVTVLISVAECAGLPLNASLPFLDVTLRNTRAIQQHSFIFGGAYSRDLSRLLHRVCDGISPRSGPPTKGSAASQNVDFWEFHQTGRESPLRKD
ncbi:hypothetical protein ACWD4J_02325 [Streptomyces sp. NPDC002577]